MTLQSTGARRSAMLPHLVLHDFLDRETVRALLDYTLAHEADFRPSAVARQKEKQFNEDIRRSLVTWELGPFRPLLRTRMLELLPRLATELRVTPVEDPTLELELVAHNDGGFLKSHIDTQIASESTTIRVLSGVYYFHAEPKGFSGGALRLYAIGDGKEVPFTDVQPVHNTLLVFPSWTRHEVMPVRCPSQRFADSRFTINCWVHRKRAAR
jgi:Rps23 Pro-64 3,4-dihydroxylase Tpa1-like proline 4-hydroxylase